ncbi:YbjN domain-containing protein [Corynebacterium sp. Marseille-P4321]|uniref:YbjN domain-containing protein n=1 Tax=Corynebacterium sp. Marseille-P4321 TaxID=2736603 RepID=UPI00158832EE|nr:YbjN domain-containing protein [Corynebacterium sp. Marseille-P4321]
MATSTVSEVTIDRIIAAMATHGIEVADDASGRAGHANVEGYNLLFVLLDSVVIVRADALTDIPADSPDATLYLAANQVNSAYLNSRALVVNKTEQLIVRTEKDVVVAAGLNDEQLGTALKRVVDGVLEAQNAMVVMMEQIQKTRDEIEAGQGE